MADGSSHVNSADSSTETRREFLYLAASAVTAVGAAGVAWPFINSLNPSADVLALSSTEISLSAIEAGQSITVTWRGKPVFVRHRTEGEIAQAREDDSVSLVDVQQDADRVQKPEWLILVGVCTHLGCVPLGQKGGESRGEFGGWFCPCHGSHYDTSGRIRKGPAPLNLAVPPYEFLDDNTVKIG